MTITHTSTRLTHRANGNANSYTLLDDQGEWFMSMLVNGRQMEARQQANLRRLAACWNACEGISTEALETGPGMLAAFQSEQDRADRAERTLEQAQPTGQRHYAVTGRLRGDDEDTLLLLTAENHDQAAEGFKTELRAIRNVDPDDPYSAEIFIGAVVWSATPIQE
ncbi:hypothetical protein IB236_13080 [Acidovorax sp. ACV02]|uniref:hypothetical protein n=1 Tax=Acidovorax sp. ACV02 TaxID=2769310 RepID=UPI00178681D3|nr:hypothetical protein [Acidovorax sp. ACV02]MBD9406275.1 hypothetical protein [Acidovorax sp. ACV02]